jgi:hypothetical protein
MMASASEDLTTGRSLRVRLNVKPDTCFSEIQQRVSFWTLKTPTENKGLRIQKVRPIIDA